MKNVLKIDHNKRVIIMDRTFEKYAADTGSQEYAQLQRVRQDYPTYHVKRRTIKKNTAQEHYKGLSYKFMEDYIMTHENADRNLAEYKELRQQAECHSVRYPVIKKWFLRTYPEITQEWQEITAKEEIPAEKVSAPIPFQENAA